MSQTIKAPDRPIPAEQWTTIGPDWNQNYVFYSTVQGDISSETYQMYKGFFVLVRYFL